MEEIIQSHVVPDGVAGVRLNDYAQNVFTCIPSRNGIKKAIKKGELKVNGQVSNTGHWVRPGEKIDLIRSLSLKRKKVFKLIYEVLYEDDQIAVINKPAGFEVSGNKFRTIENALPANLKPSQASGSLANPRPVHRLDSQTSGLLLIAKTTESQIKLGHFFEKKLVQKRYRAIVIGKTPESGEVDSPVFSRSARTTYRRVSVSPSLRNEWLSRVDLFPHTGRTHQLRIHMSESGYPILGDKLYGTEGMILKGRGLFLCAVQLSFPHPVTEEALCIDIDEPSKFNQIIQWEQRRLERKS